MKKTLFIAAVSALAASSALAQSSVTIYGRVNVTAEAIDADGVKTKQLVNNASRLGFKGIEDLGGGLKAGFQLEHRFSIDTGLATSSTYWAGQSEAFLSGGFGMLRLGRFTSEAYFATADYISMHNHDTGTSADALYAYVGSDNNKIAYRTPEFIKGLTAEASVAAGEGMGPRTWDLAINYGGGPLHVGFGYSKAGSADQYALSALYDMGGFILGGMVQRDEDGWGPGLGTRTNYRISAAYMFGANELHLNLGKAGDYSRVGDSDASQWTLGYNYNLSKRTKVYGFYTQIKASRFTPYASDFDSLAVGVRHNF